MISAQRLTAHVSHSVEYGNTSAKERSRLGDICLLGNVGESGSVEGTILGVTTISQDTCRVYVSPCYASHGKDVEDIPLMPSLEQVTKSPDRQELHEPSWEPCHPPVGKVGVAQYRGRVFHLFVTDCQLLGRVTLVRIGTTS